MLSRHPTQASLAGFPTRPSTPEVHTMAGLQRQPTMPPSTLPRDRPLPPSRTATQSSANSYTSYTSSAPLIGQESSSGYPFQGPSRSRAPLPPNHPSTYGRFEGPPLVRSVTGDSQYTHQAFNPLPRPLPSLARKMAPTIGPPSRRGTGRETYRSTAQSITVPSPVDNSGRPTLGSPISPENYDSTATLYSSHARNPPALPHGWESRAPASAIQRLPTQGGYVAFSPAMHAASSHPRPVNGQSRLPYRNITAPNDTTRNESIRQPYLPQRSGTAPLPQTTTYDDSIYDSYYRDDEDFERPTMPRRAATAGPGGPHGAPSRQGGAVSARYQRDYNHF